MKARSFSNCTLQLDGSIRIAAVLLSSYMPETSEKILDELSTSQRDAESLKEFWYVRMWSYS